MPVCGSSQVLSPIPAIAPADRSAEIGAEAARERVRCVATRRQCLSRRAGASAALHTSELTAPQWAHGPQSPRTPAPAVHPESGGSPTPSETTLAVASITHAAAGGPHTELSGHCPAHSVFDSSGAYSRPARAHSRIGRTYSSPAGPPQQLS